MNRLDMAQRMGHRLSNRPNNRIAAVRESVVDPQPLSAGLHHTGTPEVGEMSRRLWLRNAKAFMDVTDTHLAGQQQAENPQPRRVREGLKEVLQLAKLLFHRCGLTNISRPS